MDTYTENKIHELIISVICILIFTALLFICREKYSREKPEPVITVDDIIPFLICKESHDNPDAVGNAGEFGLCQITEAAAEQVGYDFARVKTEPAYNIACGRDYLRWCYDRFPYRQGLERWKYALYAYNWGIGNVRKYERGELILPKQVENYASEILKHSYGEE